MNNLDLDLQEFKVSDYLDLIFGPHTDTTERMKGKTLFSLALNNAIGVFYRLRSEYKTREAIAAHLKDNFNFALSDVVRAEAIEKIYP